MGDGVAVIAVTSVAANMSSIVAGMVVFGDALGDDFLVVKPAHRVHADARSRSVDARPGPRGRGAERAARGAARDRSKPA